jgi:hypothetical protein
VDITGRWLFTQMEAANSALNVVNGAPPKVRAVTASASPEYKSTSLLEGNPVSPNLRTGLTKETPKRGGDTFQARKVGRRTVLL